jgi:hypothetical protein
MSKKDKFVPQSKEVAKDTKMPAYEYQRPQKGTLATINEKKSGNADHPHGRDACLQSLNAAI